jgi:hypothetical protein
MPGRHPFPEQGRKSFAANILCAHAKSGKCSLATVNVDGRQQAAYRALFSGNMLQLRSAYLTNRLPLRYIA